MVIKKNIVVTVHILAPWPYLSFCHLDPLFGAVAVTPPPLDNFALSQTCNLVEIKVLQMTKILAYILFGKSGKNMFYA